MNEGRKKTEETLKQDYRDIDKQFKEQLIKTKASHGIPRHFDFRPRAASI